MMAQNYLTPLPMGGILDQWIVLFAELVKKSVNRIDPRAKNETLLLIGRKKYYQIGLLIQYLSPAYLTSLHIGLRDNEDRFFDVVF